MKFIIIGMNIGNMGIAILLGFSDRLPNKFQLIWWLICYIAVNIFLIYESFLRK